MIGKQETDKMIWKDSQSSNMRMNVCQFIYKALHNTHKIGQYWESIPQYKHRARCDACSYPNEDLEHILTDYEYLSRQQIWDLAKEIWPHCIADWPTIKLSLVTRLGSLTIKHPENDNRNNKA